MTIVQRSVSQNADEKMKQNERKYDAANCLESWQHLLVTLA